MLSTNNLFVSLSIRIRQGSFPTCELQSIISPVALVHVSAFTNCSCLVAGSYLYTISLLLCFKRRFSLLSEVMRNEIPPGYPPTNPIHSFVSNKDKAGDSFGGMPDFC